MNRFFPLSTFLSLTLFGALCVSSCAPTLNTRGNFLDNDRLTGLTAGVTTQQQVETQLGSPTTIDPFDKKTWFYIGEKTETKAFFDPDVTARRVIKVQFDEAGLLSNVAEVDEKAGQEVALVSKTTQSGGEKVNAFQQFLGNLGKFNAQQMNSGNTSPGR